MSKKSYIFVDIDGVLTDFDESVGSYITHDPESYGISKRNITNLLELCRRTDSKVVISSNWRRFPQDGTWIYQGKKYHNQIQSLRKILGDTYDGTLPVIRHITKSQALILWFEQNNITEKDIDFVIFDDDPREMFQQTDFYDIKSHFIMTDMKEGLSKKDIDEAQKILTSL